MVITFLEKVGLGGQYSEYLYIILALAVILTLGWVANFIVKRFLLEYFCSLASKTNTKVAKYLLEESFFLRLSHLAPCFCN